TRPNVPEDFLSGPGAPVLIVGPRVEVAARAAKTGIDGAPPDSRAAEDLDALPVDPPIDRTDRARASGREPRQVQRPVQLRPGVRGADGLDPSQRPQNCN